MADSIKGIQRRLKLEARATEAEIKSFTLSLSRFFDLSLSRVIRELETKKVRGAEAASMLGAIQSRMSENGLSKVLDRLRPIYLEKLKFIRDELAEVADKPLSNADTAMIDQLIRFDFSKTTNILETYVDDVRAQVMRTVIAGETPKADKIIPDVAGRLESNINTELNTSIMAFSRSVTIKKSIDLGFELFLYVGPEDKITRPFCREVLSKDPSIYTLKEIQGMDNDQGLNVLTYGGGYNCRHEFRPISEGFAKDLGWQG